MTIQPTVGQLTSVLDGRLLTGPAGSARAIDVRATELGPVVSDSRAIEAGQVFWALRGPRHEGSDFAADAFQRGAVGVVASRPVEVPPGRWALVVDNTMAALRCWAEQCRAEFNGVVIGVTGSVGKTTTRQMIHAILGSRWRGSASPRNFNNHIGVPLSMSNIRSDHAYSVLELGASHPGEIARLSELCQPKIGVITQVGDAHLGEFGSRRTIAQSKAELLAALPEDGHAILGDDAWLRQVVHRPAASVSWVGEAEHCDLTATAVQAHGGQLSFEIDGRHFSVPVWGRHHLRSALAAIGVGRLLGFSLEEMAGVLKDFRPVSMRCEVREIRGATVINDAYNANPTAMRAALELLRDMETTGRRVVVLGDMGELGDEAARLHWELGKQVVAIGQADLLITCGEFARHVVAGARAAGLPQARAIPCDKLEHTLPHLGQAILPGDAVLVKGSRMMGMERLVAAMEQYPTRRSA